jgi:iron(II)-dependent oxidoreductase
MNTKTELLEELDRTDRRTLELLDSLDDEQLNVPYEPGINPPVWELGHAAFFYEYFVLRALDHTGPAMPGYDEIWDSFEIKHSDRWKEGVVPNKATTLDYYRRTIDSVRKRIEERDLTPTDHYLYKYSIFHQHMHIESMIWSRQTLGYASPPGSNVPREGAVSDAMAAGDAQVAGGSYTIGLPADSEQRATTHFGFDNEKPQFEMEIGSFKISKTLVSNREFLEFVEDAGYENPELWSCGGRQWLATCRRIQPRYWTQSSDGSWLHQRFDRQQDLPLDVPVMHVTFWEAEAFARWAGRRLSTEFEWEAAARGADGRLYPWGSEPDGSSVDMDGTSLGLLPVTALQDGAAPSGCLQMIGTAWEWTTSQFLPYNGYCVDMYPYMSTLQFGDHKVARGGSCATSSCLIRNTYRQAYQPFRDDVFTGFRTCAL